jgi:predicted deacetylase
MKRRSVVVSIHDVSPGTRDRVETMLSELGGLGVERTSLLVVPNHHHRGHFLEDRSFIDWLRGLAQAGHEIVIHGYYHQRQRREQEGTAARLITRVYTADEGEFYDVDEPAAVELVSRAQREFSEAGFQPAGFIAPAWLLSDAGERALCRCGIGYTTRLGTVHDLKTGHVEKSQSLVWSVRSGWRRAMSRAWNRALYAIGAPELLRIGLHPPDITHPGIWRQIRAIIADAATRRVVTTYADWIEAARARGK